MMIDIASRWSEIPVCSRRGSSVRISASHKLDLFIGYSEDGSRLLRLESDRPVFSSEQLPSFQNIDLAVISGHGRSELSVVLMNGELSGLFTAIITDLVSASSVGESESAAAQIFINRLIRWATLLEERRRSGLSEAQQLGLLGELYILNYVLENCLADPDTAVRGWRGPDGDSRDVALNTISIEVKASLATSKNVLRISSLDQLDVAGRQLLIARCQFSPATQGVSIAALIEKISRRIPRGSTSSSDFWRKLYLVGYEDSASYVDECFDLSSLTFYEVNEDFPRLVPGVVHPAIRSVKYEIDCGMLGGHKISEEDLEAMIHG